MAPTDTILKGNHSRSIWAKFGFIPSSGFEEEDFQRFQFFHQSEAMEAILEVGQGHWTHFWKRIIQGVSCPSLVQFGPFVLEIKMWKVDICQMQNSMWWWKLTWTFGCGELNIGKYGSHGFHEVYLWSFV